MKTRQCPACGAPLPKAPMTSGVRCDFCGREIAPELMMAPPQKVVVELRGVGDALRGGRRLLLAILGITVVVVLGLGATALFSLRSVPAGRAPSLDNALELVKKVSRAVDQPLVVAPPPSGYATFDPAVNLPWALTLAQAWSRDARLRRVDVQRLRSDGTVNAMDDVGAVVQYRFESPAVIREHEKAADLDATVESPYQYWVIVTEGEVRGRVLAGRPDDGLPPAFPAIPPLTQLLALAREQPQFQPRPFYNGYLIQLEDEGWVWYLSGLSGRDSMPRIRATDGRLYPY